MNLSNFHGKEGVDGSSPSEGFGSSREPEHGDDRQLVTKETSDAWGRYGTALAQAHASLGQPDRAVLVAALESLAEATNALARVLAG